MVSESELFLMTFLPGMFVIFGAMAPTKLELKYRGLIQISSTEENLLVSKFFENLYPGHITKIETYVNVVGAVNSDTWLGTRVRLGPKQHPKLWGSGNGQLNVPNTMNAETAITSLISPYPCEFFFLENSNDEQYHKAVMDCEIYVRAGMPFNFEGINNALGVAITTGTINIAWIVTFAWRCLNHRYDKIADPVFLLIFGHIDLNEATKTQWWFSPCDALLRNVRGMVIDTSDTMIGEFAMYFGYNIPATMGPTEFDGAHPSYAEGYLEVNMFGVNATENQVGAHNFKREIAVYKGNPLLLVNVADSGESGLVYIYIRAEFHPRDGSPVNFLYYDDSLSPDANTDLFLFPIDMDLINIKVSWVMTATSQAISKLYVGINRHGLGDGESDSSGMGGFYDDLDVQLALSEAILSPLYKGVVPMVVERIAETQTQGNLMAGEKTIWFNEYMHRQSMLIGFLDTVISGGTVSDLLFIIEGRAKSDGRVRGRGSHYYMSANVVDTNLKVGFPGGVQV